MCSPCCNIHHKHRLRQCPGGGEFLPTYSPVRRGFRPEKETWHKGKLAHLPQHCYLNHPIPLKFDSFNFSLTPKTSMQHVSDIQVHTYKYIDILLYISQIDSLDFLNFVLNPFTQIVLSTASRAGPQTVLPVP